MLVSSEYHKEMNETFELRGKTVLLFNYFVTQRRHLRHNCPAFIKGSIQVKTILIPILRGRKLVEQIAPPRGRRRHASRVHTAHAPAIHPAGPYQSIRERKMAVDGVNGGGSIAEKLDWVCFS